MNSSNGTQINDADVHSQELADGDLVRIGKAVLRYRRKTTIEQDAGTDRKRVDSFVNLATVKGSDADVKLHSTKKASKDEA